MAEGYRAAVDLWGTDSIGLSFTTAGWGTRSGLSNGWIVRTPTCHPHCQVSADCSSFIQIRGSDVLLGQANHSQEARSLSKIEMKDATNTLIMDATFGT
jgi:hypothetical protein